MRVNLDQRQEQPGTVAAGADQRLTDLGQEPPLSHNIGIESYCSTNDPRFAEGLGWITSSGFEQMLTANNDWNGYNSQPCSTSVERVQVPEAEVFVSQASL